MKEVKQSENAVDESVTLVSDLTGTQEAESDSDSGEATVRREASEAAGEANKDAAVSSELSEECSNNRDDEEDENAPEESIEPDFSACHRHFPAKRLPCQWLPCRQLRRALVAVIAILLFAGWVIVFSDMGPESAHIQLMPGYSYQMKWHWGRLSNDTRNALQSKQYQQALALGKESLEYSNKFGPSNRRRFLSLMLIGRALMGLKKFREAESVLSDALRQEKDSRGKYCRDQVDTLACLADLRTLEGKYKEAGEFLHEAFRLGDWAGNYRAFWALDELAVKRGDLAASKQVRQMVLQEELRQITSASYKCHKAYCDASFYDWYLGRANDARKYYEEAMRTSATVPNADKWLRKHILASYASFLYAHGDRPQASQMEKMAESSLCRQPDSAYIAEVVDPIIKRLSSP
jgi:tetratricopeptide (TPR) repeat protein